MTDDMDGSIEQKTPRETDREWKRGREPLDFSPSSTATDPSHAAQDTSESVKTGRHAYTENATFTTEQIKAPSKREHSWGDREDGRSPWATLNEVNRNFFVDDDKNIGSEQHKQNYVNDTQAWGSQIGLTDWEIKRAAKLVLDADDGWKNNHSIEAVILAALTVSANKATGRRNDLSKAIRPRNPLSENTPDMASTYEDIRDNLGVDYQSVKACRNHLRQFL